MAAAAAIPGCVFALLYLDRLGGLLESVSGVITAGIGALFVRRGLAAGAPPQPARDGGSERLLHAGVGGVGLLMGLIGMGGGFSIAALLVFVRGMTAAKSVGTALFVGVVVIIAGTAATIQMLGLR